MKIVYVNMPSDAWRIILPDALEINAERGMGGTEFATIMSAIAAAELGHEVYHIGNFTVRDRRYRDITWLGFEEANQAPFQDALVWQACFAHDVPGKTRLLFQHWNDYNYLPSGWDQKIDIHAFSSSYHERYCKATCANGNPADWRTVVSNFGVFSDWLTNINWDKRLNRIVYGSSPDRGLHHLLKVYPTIYEVTHAELLIAYKLKEWLVSPSHGQADTDRKSSIQRLLADMSGLPITITGHIGHRPFLKLLGESKCLAYPCDPISHTESFGLVVYEALSAGCKVVTTDADAFPELYARDAALIERESGWLDGFVKATISTVTSGQGPKLFQPRSWTEHVHEVLEVANGR